MRNPTEAILLERGDIPPPNEQARWAGGPMRVNAETTRITSTAGANHLRHRLPQPSESAPDATGCAAGVLLSRVAREGVSRCRGRREPDGVRRSMPARSSVGEAE